MGEGLSHVYTASFNYFLGYVQEDGFSSHGFIFRHIYYFFAEIYIYYLLSH